ncbi:MAG: hypothetical protein H7222_07935 [Methylotenera sp.]|nr:hypothetical protein [Oligoflexia bacterium]
MAKTQKTSQSRKSGSSSLAQTAQRLWKQVFAQALKQYGKRAQAERIANCAVTPDQGTTRPSRAATKVTRRKRAA